MKLLNEGLVDGYEVGVMKDEDRDDYHVFGDNIFYLKAEYDYEYARELFNTMRNCSNCINCKNLINCKFCEVCYDCASCERCHSLKHGFGLIGLDASRVYKQNQEYLNVEDLIQS
jgi:hypothetical protein